MTRTSALLICLIQLACSQAAAAPLAGGAGQISALAEQELLDLAYAARSEKDQHDEALKVAEQAIRARPADRQWRRRAARSAELAGQNNRALAHWLFLSEIGDGTARESALRLSRSMNEFPVRRYLLEAMLAAGGHDPALVKEYLAVSEAMEEGREAHQLPASQAGSGNRELLREQAPLEGLPGKPAGAFNALDGLALIRPLTPGEALQRAGMMSGQGYLERAGPPDFLPPLQFASQPAPADANPPGVPAAAGEARRSFNWNTGSRRQAAGRRYFLISPPALGALARYEINQDERTVSGQKSTDHSHTFSERLDLASSGFVYHPALLQFNLKFSPEFRQHIRTRSELSGGTGDNVSSFSPNYQAGALLLGLKPYSLALSAHHLEEQSWTTYTGLNRSTTDSYGADLALKYSLVPTTLGISSSRSEQAGYYGSSSKWQEAHLLSRHQGVTGSSSLTASYSRNQQVTNLSDSEIDTFNSAFSNQYQTSGDGRVGLATNVHLMSQQSGNLQNDSLQMSESLSWRHRENLRSQYALSHRRSETGATSNNWSTLDGRLTHKLYENLTTTVGGAGTLNSYSGGEEKTMAALFNSSYQRRLANWGSLGLNGGVNYLYTTRQGESGSAELSNEPHTLAGGAETFLDQSGISTESVLVTNSAGTIVYIRDIDYRIDQIGSSLRISRLPLGAVLDGQLVLVSYSYRRDAGFDDAVLTQDYGISLDVKQSLFLSYRYLQSRQTLLAGPAPEVLSSASFHLAAIRYLAGWSETGATFEDNESSSNISYRRWELSEALRLQSGPRLQYNLRGYYGQTDYRSHEEEKNSFGATTNFNWTPLYWLRFEMEGYLEQVDGTLENSRNLGARAGIWMNYRLWTVRLGHKLSEQDNRINNYKRRSQVMQLELTRPL